MHKYVGHEILPAVDLAKIAKVCVMDFDSSPTFNFLGQWVVARHNPVNLRGLGRKAKHISICRGSVYGSKKRRDMLKKYA